MSLNKPTKKLIKCIGKNSQKTKFKIKDITKQKIEIKIVTCFRSPDFMYQYL